MKAIICNRCKKVINEDDIEAILEINLTPHYHDNEDNPYFWVILQYTTNGWVNTGQCGWSKTPTEASVTALRSYNDLTVSKD